MIKENTTIKDINLDLVGTEVVSETLKEVQVKYLNCYINIELFNYLIAFMESEKKTESKENKKAMDLQIEETRQKKLATIKMIPNHENNIKLLKNLISN